MQTQFTKKIDFTGKQLFIGLSVLVAVLIIINHLISDSSKQVEYTKCHS